MRGQVLLTNLDPTGMGGKKREKERERERKEESLKRERLYLLSRFFGDRSIESRRDKRQS